MLCWCLLFLLLVCLQSNYLYTYTLNPSLQNNGDNPHYGALALMPLFNNPKAVINHLILPLVLLTLQPLQPSGEHVHSLPLVPSYPVSLWFVHDNKLIQLRWEQYDVHIFMYTHIYISIQTLLISNSKQCFFI